MTDEEMAEEYKEQRRFVSIDDDADVVMTQNKLLEYIKQAFLAGLEVGETMQVEQIKDISDKRLEPILYRLKDLGVIKSWYYNGTYHAC